MKFHFMLLLFSFFLGEINNDEKTIELNKLKPIFVIFENFP